MAINQYFDESKIIKKKPKDQTVEEKEQEAVENIQIEEEIEMEEEIPNQIEMVEIQEDINQKAKEYVEAIKDFQQEKKEKPVYNISRNNQGKVVINPKKSLKASIEEKEEETDKSEEINLFYDQYLKIKSENERKIEFTRVEIIIHNNLIKRESNPDKIKNYNSRLNILMNDLELLNKRKSILEDDSLWQKG